MYGWPNVKPSSEPLSAKQAGSASHPARGEPLIPLLLAALLAADPVAPPQLIDIDGSITLTDGGNLAPGTVCLTPLKAASVRDDLVDKNARLVVLEAGSMDKRWLWVAIGAGVVATGAAAAAGFVAGQQKR